MFGFLLKKNFCDGWDNLLSVVMVNVIILLVGFGLVLLNTLAFATQALLPEAASLLVSFIVISIMVFALYL